MGKLLGIFALAALMAAPVLAQDVYFGNDTSEYAKDGECDDRRFTGQAMADGLSYEHAGKDASDCRKLFEASSIKLWIEAEAAAATQCAAIDFGDDSSEWSEDGECDDPRFEGRGAASMLLRADASRDASDCRRLCDLSLVFLRDY